MDTATTVVIDAGVRYGIHPSWQNFDGELLYLGFEPDQSEANRLSRIVKKQGFKIVACAVAEKSGLRDLYITKHRGYCSFLKPDLDSEWFKRYRPGEGEIETIEKVQAISIDEYTFANHIRVDFLKIDTEGIEHEVLRGADGQLTQNVLGLRIGTYFQACYRDQSLFPEIHNYLLQKDFFLLNLDYFGQGVPRNCLFRKPDPLSPGDLRYGTLISADGIWLKKYDSVVEMLKDNGEHLAFSTLKYAYFSILNHAPDVAIDTLRYFVVDIGRKFDSRVKETNLYIALRRTCARFLGSWRVYPDSQWDFARSMFSTIFELDLESGSRYWEQIQSL